MAFIDTVKGWGSKIGSLFDKVGPTYTRPAPAPQVTGDARVPSRGAVVAPPTAADLAKDVRPNYVVLPPPPAKPPAPAPKPPAAPVPVASVVQPTLDRLAAEAGNSSSGSAPTNFTAPVDTPTKTTDIQPKGVSDVQRLRDEYQKRFAPSKAELAARDQLTRAEQALANVTAGQTARLADLRYYNPEGVFGGGQATREGQISRESTLQAIQAQGGLSAAQSAYDRLSQARQQELANFQTIQGLTAPEVLGTPSVNKSTGDVTAYIQNPDGTVSTQVIGNVGVDESFDLQSVIRNEATGQAFAVGLQNGKVVTQPLDGTAGLAPKSAGGEYGGLGGFLGLNEAGYDTTEDFVKVLNSSKGGKLLNDTPAQMIAKTMRAAEQLEGINQSLLLEQTGPIMGILRSANPYDTKAQLVRAQLQSFVPNLARGVYGEVGVLTDADIENYSRTIPNLKSTAEVNNAILGMTQKAILNSLQSTLETEAANGRDVSGYAPIYARVRNQAESKLQPGNAPSGPGYDDLPDDIKSEGGFWKGISGYFGF